MNRSNQLFNALCYEGSDMNNTLRKRAAITSAVCSILNNADVPLTASGIRSALEKTRPTWTAHGWHSHQTFKFDVYVNAQAITHALRRLVKAGAIKREKINTGVYVRDNGETVQCYANAYSVIR